MASIIGIVGTVSALALLALVVVGIISFRRGHLSFPTIVHTYTAFLLAVCLVLALSGGALLIKCLASAVIARDFSYQTVDYPGSMPFAPTAADRAATQVGDDLSAGITLLVIGGGLGIVHAFGNAVAARRDTETATLVERGFAVTMLVVGAVVGLASCAMLLNDLLRRYVVTTAPSAYNEPRPGGSLGFALLFVPLWIYFARRVWRMLALREGAQAGDSDSETRDEGRTVIAGSTDPQRSTAAEAP